MKGTARSCGLSHNRAVSSSSGWPIQLWQRAGFCIM